MQNGINTFLFTDLLKKTYSQVCNTGINLKIIFKLINAENTNGVGGICALKKENNIPYIEIAIRKDRLQEDVISHELLHALFIKMGFGSTSYNPINDIPFREISALLSSVIQHKKIYQMQQTMGIDMTKSKEHKAKTIFKNIEQESSIINYDTVVNALLLLECLVAADEYEEIYLDKVDKHFKHTYELAKKLNAEIFSEDINKAEIYRQKYISALRICDEYLSTYMPNIIPHYKFTENISISFIPAQYQLKLKCEQVFDFKESIYNTIIMSKEDNQACYIIGKLGNMDSIKQATVEQLIGAIDGVMTVKNIS